MDAYSVNHSAFRGPRLAKCVPKLRHISTSHTYIYTSVYIVYPHNIVLSCFLQPAKYSYKGVWSSSTRVQAISSTRIINERRTCLIGDTYIPTYLLTYMTVYIYVKNDV